MIMMRYAATKMCIPIGPPKGIEVRDVLLKYSFFIDVGSFGLDFIENNIIL